MRMRERRLRHRRGGPLTCTVRPGTGASERRLAHGAGRGTGRRRNRAGGRLLASGRVLRAGGRGCRGRSRDRGRGRATAVSRALALCRRAGQRLSCRLSPPGLRLGLLAREGLFEPADNRRLDCRGRRANELAHFLELGHDGLALYAELFSELVYPDLRHCAPSTRPGYPDQSAGPGQRVLRPASASAVHRHMLIGRSLQSQPALCGTYCRACLTSNALPSDRPILAARCPDTTPRDTQRARRWVAVPAGAAPAGSPGDAGLAPSIPDWDAGTHPGQAFAQEGRRLSRPRLPPGEASRT